VGIEFDFGGKKSVAKEQSDRCENKQRGAEYHVRIEENGSRTGKDQISEMARACSTPCQQRLPSLRRLTAPARATRIPAGFE